KNTPCPDCSLQTGRTCGSRSFLSRPRRHLNCKGRQRLRRVTTEPRTGSNCRRRQTAHLRLPTAVMASQKPIRYGQTDSVRDGTSTTITQFETYYRSGSLFFGTEYFLVHVNSPQRNNPFFNGGEAVVTWLPTGEIRAYNTRGRIL